MIRLAMPVALLGAYAVSPYLSLFEMGQALKHGDVATLSASIDWKQVRAGLKEDIADGITGEPTPTASPAVANSDDLPPFGSGFVTNVAANMVDRTVTPLHLAQTVSAMRAAGAPCERPVVESAHFEGPGTFMVSLRPAHAAADSPAVRLRLDLVSTQWGMRWEITRAWLPESVLAQSETHTS
jgi:hypothetical protein